MLDIGCGSGGPPFFFARYYGLHVEAVDLSSNMINFAKERLDREDPIVKERVSD